MKVLVDTSVWSLALRRSGPSDSAEVDELMELIREGRTVMVGAIRQELLSGVRSTKQFRMLRDRLRDFPDLPLEHLDYEEAASCFNTCRSKGVQGSNTDFLLCAISLRHNVAILTTDGDFQHYKVHLGVRLHETRQ